MSDPKFNLRPATPDDVPLILSFIRELADYEKLPDEVDATEALLREHLFGASPCAEVIIADVTESPGCPPSPAGFALFFRHFSTFRGRPGIYLEDLFVRAQFRGLGIGKALLVHLAKLARQRGCPRFEWSVLDWNTPAIEFYKRLGAVPMSEWTVFRVTGEALDRLAGM